MGFLNAAFGGAGQQGKQANQAFGQASDAATNYGQTAGNVNAQLQPFLTRELNNPQGYSQQDLTAQTSAAEAGAGGANSGIQGVAAERQGASGNPSGFSMALDDAARQKDKAAAGASEGIAANNAQLKQTQQQDAAKGLSNLYGEDVGAQMKSMAIEPEDVKAGVDAQQNNWFSNLPSMGTMSKGRGCWRRGIVPILPNPNDPNKLYPPQLLPEDEALIPKNPPLWRVPLRAWIRVISMPQGRKCLLINRLFRPLDKG